MFFKLLLWRWQKQRSFYNHERAKTYSKWCSLFSIFIATSYRNCKNHPAFGIDTNLIILAAKYGRNIIYLPKFHSELSPIEGVWAHEKQYIRKNTDQSFQAFRKLLSESRENLNSHFLIQKLWRRFWRTVEDYSNKINFLDILTNTLV